VRRSGHNGGLSPRLTQAQRALIAEIMTIKRTASAEEADRLPLVREIAYAFHTHVSVIYRIASGRKPYRRVHPRDRQISQGAQP
jgi:hypothetical protein